MAVKKKSMKYKNKKYNGDLGKNNVNDTKNDVLDNDIIEEDNKDISKEIILEYKEDTLEKNIGSKLDDGNIKDNGKKKKIYMNIFWVLLIIFIVGLIMMFFPRIKLLGEDNMVITYNDKYMEPGYNGYIFNKDISNKVKVINNVDNGVIGNYEIIYYIDLFGVKFKKIRKVNIVDKDSPQIEVDSDVIHVCPNQEIPDFDYKAIDGYDGDITSRVEKNVMEDEVILSVSDLSNNTSTLSIKVDRVDSISPVINLKGNSIMYLDYGNKYIEPGYTVSDNCDIDLGNKVVVSGNVGRDIGTYVLTYEVTDSSGNKGKNTRKVIVGNKIKDEGIINNGSVYLTFDDGPNQGTTSKILDILKEEGVKATFFVTCNGPDSLIKRIYDEGHTVALHTASHNYSYIYSSVDNYFSDLYKVRDRVKRITGYDSKIIRFPGGSSNTVSRNYKIGIMTELSYLVLNEGYHYFDWNVDAMDASSAKNSGDVYYNVTSNLSANRMNVVLMHDMKNITVSALRDIIRFGKENGYSFNKIDMNTYMIRHGINN